MKVIRIRDWYSAQPIAESRAYSSDYFSAKDRFVATCRRLRFDMHPLPVEAASPTGKPLTIDVAIAGDVPAERALVVSSGVHGVEAFFGSAVQIAFLESLPDHWQPPADTAFVFIHAINPFGFAWQRRSNEENVDLNRNFLLAGEQYAGAPPLCGVIRRALKRHPRLPRFAPPASKLALIAMRHGMRAFWDNLPVGQYEYPDWLFFGGSGRSQAASLLESALPVLIGNCQDVIHLDFHTGLGRWAECKLLLSEYESADRIEWWRAQFGSVYVAGPRKLSGGYQIRGGFGTWLQARFPHCRYRFATAEFGTYSPLRVIRSLADELHWHEKLGAELPEHPARRRLTEAFVPRDSRWRTQTLRTGVSLVARAADLLQSDDLSAGLGASR